MARGSDGGTGAGNNFTSTEMLQSGGQIDNSGKYTVSRKYYVTSEADLITTPQSISVGAKTMFPSALSYQKISGGVWEKTIDFTAAVQATDTGVVKALSANETKGYEGRLQMDVSAVPAAIEQHPEINDLMKKYNGFTKNGKVIFPEKYREPGDTGTTTGALKTNPFFGVRYYYQPNATIRHTYSVEKMPANIWAGVFCIVKTEQLPGGFPPLDDYLNKEGASLKYYWQIQMPQIAIVGGRIEITDTYTLMQPRTEQAAQDFNKIAAG
jgi:hypothetical protein